MINSKCFRQGQTQRDLGAQSHGTGQRCWQVSRVAGAATCDLPWFSVGGRRVSCPASRDSSERRVHHPGRGTMVSTRSAVTEPRTDAPHDAEGDLDRVLLEKFRRYRRTSDPALREELVCHYLPLAKRIGRRYVRVGVPLDDLAQIGTIGLMNAVSSFDPGRGVKFEAYAYHHIAGEIRHYLRDAVDQVRAPRWVRKLYGELTEAVAGLRQDLGRTPTLSEIALRMILTEAGVLEILRAHNQSRVH